MSVASTKTNTASFLTKASHKIKHVYIQNPRLVLGLKGLDYSFSAHVKLRKLIYHHHHHHHLTNLTTMTPRKREESVQQSDDDDAGHLSPTFVGAEVGCSIRTFFYRISFAQTARAREILSKKNKTKKQKQHLLFIQTEPSDRLVDEPSVGSTSRCSVQKRAVWPWP